MILIDYIHNHLLGQLTCSMALKMFLMKIHNILFDYIHGFLAALSHTNQQLLNFQKFTNEYN